jgi:hypothetical protein
MRAWRSVGLLLLLAMPSAAAHAVAQPGAGGSLADAIFLGEAPVAFYDSLPAHGGIRYYSLDAPVAGPLLVRLVRPDGPAPAFDLRAVAVMGPGVADRGLLMSFVEVPPDAGVTVVQENATSDVVFEPVLAIATRITLEAVVVLPSPGRYHLAVYATDTGGAFGLRLGGEAPFSLRGLVQVPTSALDLHAWAGQSPWVAGAPAYLAFASVGLLVARRSWRARLRSPLRWFALGAAALIFASAVTFVVQATWHRAFGLAVLPTVGLALAGLALSATAAAVAFRPAGPVARPLRLVLAAAGFSSFLLWLGFVWGPLLAIVAALVQDEAPGK